MNLKTLLILGVVSITSALASVSYASSVMGPGSYTCENSDHEIIAQFYVRKDGTSKRVVITSAVNEENGSGVEGCYRASFNVISTQAEVSDAYCCPAGAN